MTKRGPLILGGRPAQELIQQILTYSRRQHRRAPIRLCRHETVQFPDGELKPRIHQNVRGQHVVFVQCACAFQGTSVNDALWELLLFCDALGRASVGAVTVLLPYFAYGRQDRKDEARTAVSASVLAKCVECALSAVPQRRVITFDLHNLAIEGFFTATPCNPLTAFTEFVPHLLADGYTLLLSPDAGGTPRAEATLAMMEDYRRRHPGLFHHDPLMSFAYKRRRSSNHVEIRWIADSTVFQGRRVAIVDDIISTGTTACEVAKTVREKLGATSVALCAPHGVCPGDAWKRLGADVFDHVYIGHTLPVLERLPHPLPSHWTVVDMAPVLAEAIHQVHTDGSLTSLWRRRPPIPRRRPARRSR